jgi:hypothetical protein
MAGEIGPEDDSGKAEEVFILSEPAGRPGRRLAG